SAAGVSGGPDLTTRAMLGMRVASVEQRLGILRNGNGLMKRTALDQTTPTSFGYPLPVLRIGFTWTATAERPTDVIEWMRTRNRSVATDVTTDLEQAIAAALHVQAAFFERIQADNEGALSRLYAEHGSE